MREIDLTQRSDEKLRELLAPAALALKDGGLVVMPTSTIYALAADATNPKALRRVYAAKKRDPYKPILALVDSFAMMKTLVESIPPEVRDLDTRLGSRGLTFILRAAPGVPSELTGGTGDVGVRIERNEVVQELLSLTGTPLTGTSANVQGQGPATTVDEALRQLRDWVDVAIRWWPSTSGAASTIVDLTGTEPKVLREGTVPAEEIGKVLAG